MSESIITSSYKSFSQMQFVTASALTIFICYFSSLAIYRLYLSPLSKFPGPKLAALSAWYAGYHDLVRGGQYIFVIEEMHQKYGPIVRVRPDVLHVCDPAFIDVLYSSSQKHARERYRTVTQSIQAPGSVLASNDHNLHRSRRSVLNPFFSKQSIRRVDSIILKELGILLSRLDGWAHAQKPISLNIGFRAATQDIIQEYAFGAGKNCLEMEDCNSAFFDIMTPQRVVHLGTYVYWLAYLMANMPPWIMIAMIPRVAVFADFMNNLAQQIERLREHWSNSKQSDNTIFHEIMKSDIPESEKQTKRLADEAMVLLIAGSETTASTLAALWYHLLADRALLARLKTELAPITDPTSIPDVSKLDQLPFLNALIQETLRLYPGATHRQDRVAPNEALVYRATTGEEYVIPQNVAVGMSAPLVNRYAGLYDRPKEFLPDRYIKNPTLSKYLLTFSKGTRQCLGMNLALRELQVLVAGVFCQYSIYDPSKDNQDGPTMELYQTTVEDVRLYGDYVTPGLYPGSHGLRVIVRQ